MKNSFLKKYKSIIKETKRVEYNRRPLPHIDPELCIAYITDALDRYQEGWHLEECSPNSWGTYVCKDSKLCVRYIVEGDSEHSTFTIKLLNIGYKYGKGTYGSEGKEYLDLVDEVSENPEAILWEHTEILNKRFEEMIEAEKYDNFYISKIMMSWQVGYFWGDMDKDEKIKALPKKEIKRIDELFVYLLNGSENHKKIKTNILMSIPDVIPGSFNK